MVCHLANKEGFDDDVVSFLNKFESLINAANKRKMPLFFLFQNVQKVVTTCYCCNGSSQVLVPVERSTTNPAKMSNTTLDELKAEIDDDDS